MRNENSSPTVIFRRYRRTKDGKLLDAYAYGLRAWPIRVTGKRRQPH